MQVSIADPWQGAASIQATAASGLTTQITDLAGAAVHAAAWDHLVANAQDASPFFGRRVIEAHLRSGLSAAPQFVIARRHDRLLGLLPFRRGGARLGWLARANAAWISPFTTSTTPLVAAGEVRPALSALLDAMVLSGDRLWTFPQLPLDDEVGRTLREEIARRGWNAVIMAEHERAVFDRRKVAGREVLASNRRKDLRRRRRRLAEQGAIATRIVTGSAEMAAAIDAFLELEARGWKGRRGTALASRARTAAFAHALFGTASPESRPRADLLTLNGRPIAVSLALVCGGTAYLLKSAYDEDLARFAPGLLLEEDIVQDFLATGFAERLNSAAGAGCVLEQLYPHRERVGDLLFAIGSEVTADRLGALAAAEMRRRSISRRAKDLYWRLRERLA